MAEINENENVLDEVRTDAETPETVETPAKSESIPERSESKRPKGNYKTVQQLALEYGLSKQGIILRINKMLAEVAEDGLEESDYISRGKKNTIYVLEPGLIWLARFNADNSPMQAPTPNNETELYREQIDELKKTIDFLQSELISKGNQINGLTATMAKQADVISNQNEKLLALTASKEDPEPSEDTATETPPQKAPEGAETGVSISEDELRAEVAKKSFWGKLALLFG